MIGRGFQLSVMVALGSEAASGSLRPPRLVTGTESALPITHGSGSSVWLVLAAALAGCLTILWWVWWGVRVYRSRVDAEERAFRRLSRAMRLRVFEREVLRRACAARGVHPIAAIGSPEVAEVGCWWNPGRPHAEFDVCVGFSATPPRRMPVQVKCPFQVRILDCDGGEHGVRGGWASFAFLEDDDQTIEAVHRADRVGLGNTRRGCVCSECSRSRARDGLRSRHPDGRWRIAAAGGRLSTVHTKGRARP
jgi:hypothetical protein